MVSRKWRIAIISSLTSISLTASVATAVAAEPPLPLPFASATAAATGNQVGVRVDGNTIFAWWPETEGAVVYEVELLDASGNRVGTPLTGNRTYSRFYGINSGTYRLKVTPYTNSNSTDEPLFSGEFTTTNKKSKPAQTDQPSIQLIGNNSVDVQWYRNTNGGLDIQYSTVTLTPTDGGRPVAIQVEGDVEQATVDDLESGKTYTATVTAHNELGDSPESTPSNQVTVTEDPGTLSLTVTPKEIDATTDSSITVTGSGYTGGAVAKGLYVVVWDTSHWLPGYRPATDYKGSALSVEVTPAEITDGNFTKTIEIPANELKLNQGVRYLVGTLAGGSAIAEDRRADQAQYLNIAAQPVPWVELAQSNTSLEAEWGSAGDDRIREYKATLYKFNPEAEKGTDPWTYKDDRTTGPQLTQATFSGVGPGIYRLGVKANIGATDWDPVWSEEIYSSTVAIAETPKTAPVAPQKPILQTTDAPGTLEVSWLDGEPGPDSARTTGYTVILHQGDQSVTRTAEADESQLRINGLKDGTWTAVIIAHSNVGDSPASVASDPVEVTNSNVNHTVDLQVSQELVDTKEDSTLTISGSGYTDIEKINLAIVEKGNPSTKLVPVEVAVPESGKFKTQLVIPAGTLDATKSYNVVSYTTGGDNDEYQAMALLKLASAEVANPQMTVTPTSLKAGQGVATLTVEGTGYVGDGAAKGAYVVVYDTATWEPQTAPAQAENGSNPSAKKLLTVAQTWVQPGEITNGGFTTSLSVDTNLLEKGHTYAVGSFAAHALSLTDRSLDQSVPVTVEFGSEPDTPTPPDTDKGSSDNSDASAGIIAGSVLAALAGLTIIIGGLLHFFPREIQALLARLNLR